MCHRRPHVKSEMRAGREAYRQRGAQLSELSRSEDKCAGALCVEMTPRNISVRTYAGARSTLTRTQCRQLAEASKLVSAAWAAATGVATSIALPTPLQRREQDAKLDVAGRNAQYFMFMTR